MITRKRGETHKQFIARQEAEIIRLNQDLYEITIGADLLPLNESMNIKNLKQEMIKLIDEMYNAEISLKPNFDLRNKLSEMKVKLMYG